MYTLRILHVACWLIAISFFMVGGVDAQSPRPNVVIMLVDDMGVMDTSVPFMTDEAGLPKRYPLNDYYRTPSMERLASRGVRFNNFCAMSVCSPTRVSIMTGQNAARHRTTNWINPDNNNAGPQGARQWNWEGLKPDDVTLARLMQQSGYRTIHVGKGHFGPRHSPGADPRSLGFDINVGGASIGAPASYYGQKNYGNAGGEVDKQSPAAVPGLEAYHGTDTFLTDALTKEALKHVTQAVDDKRPFFLYLAHYAVHAPFNSDPRFAEHYRSRDKNPQAQAFATLIEGMDKSLGDVLDRLEQLGVAEETLVVFLGDNGSDAPLGHEHTVACAAPLRGKKGSHYEGGMRVPFIAAWAQPNEQIASQQRFPIAVGGIQPQQAAVQDLLPTLLQLTQIDAPAGHIIDGYSLKQLLTGKPDANRAESFLMHYPHGPHRTSYWSSLREADWKIIYHYFPSDVSDGSHYQLFHLADDPFEQVDLSTRESQQLSRMMQRLAGELTRHQAIYPIDPSGQSVLPKLP